MTGYDEHIHDVLSELERSHRFLLGLYAERVMIMKALTLLMMDKGIYELNIKDEDIQSIEGYEIEYEVSNGIVKVSIQFPKVNPEEIL